MRNLAFVSRRYIRVEVGMHINKSMCALAVCVYGEVIHTQHITVRAVAGMDFAQHNNEEREKRHWVAAINKNVSPNAVCKRGL